MSLSKPVLVVVGWIVTRVHLIILFSHFCWLLGDANNVYDKALLLNNNDSMRRIYIYV